MEQEPGPRGSPQLPQAPDGTDPIDAPLACTANTESSAARFFPLHFGQLAFSFPMIRASKEFLQSLQVYSKIGISRLSQ
jgi:hypothetical protein